ncbi:MAG: hypothetical protein GKS00_20150 [Alphaproteobacteria bacterium]|nr:hypothetical protein [Alphaproteobacteria bacterium]
MRYLAIFFILAITGGALAETITERNEIFRTECISTHSARLLYDYRKQKWTSPDSYLPTYIVEKIPATIDGEPNKKAARCAHQYIEEKNEWDSANASSSTPWKFFRACYNVRINDSSFDNTDTELCNERWKNSSSGEHLSKVSCSKPNFVFEPNGNFQLAKMNWTAHDTTDHYKEMRLNAGKCSLID